MRAVFCDKYSRSRLVYLTLRACVAADMQFTESLVVSDIKTAQAVDATVQHLQAGELG